MAKDHIGAKNGTLEFKLWVNVRIHTDPVLTCETVPSSSGSPGLMEQSK